MFSLQTVHLVCRLYILCCNGKWMQTCLSVSKNHCLLSWREGDVGGMWWERQRQNSLSGWLWRGLHGGKVKRPHAGRPEDNPERGTRESCFSGGSRTQDPPRKFSVLSWALWVWSKWGHSQWTILSPSKTEDLNSGHFWLVIVDLF